MRLLAFPRFSLAGTQPSEAMLPLDGAVLTGEIFEIRETPLIPWTGPCNAGAAAEMGLT